MTRYVIHNHIPARRTKDDNGLKPDTLAEHKREHEALGLDAAPIEVRSEGKLDSDGIASVEVYGPKGKVGSGFWDTHASAYWITPKGGSEKMFHDKADIVKYFQQGTIAGGRPARPAMGVGARDANQAYKVKVRQLATGSDYSIRIFAPSQEQAEQRAKYYAQREYKISPEKMKELNAKGIAVFRIVSSEVDPDQSRRNYDRRDASATKSLGEGEARATGASLTDYLDTSGQVRDWCRSEGYSRVTEAFVVSGFKAQRKRDGLSENV